jgi:hypothetical protein
MCCIITIAAVSVLLINSPIGDAKSAAISSDTAVYQALQYATTGFPSGKLEGIPSEVRGQLLSYNQATDLSLKGTATLSGEPDMGRPTWVIVFRGKIVVDIQGSADGKIPPKQEVFPQMSIVLDGKTGEVLSVTMHAPGDELKADTLPILKLPSQVPVDRPVIPSRPTTVPEPTFVPPSN